jgi:broad specificity phosphatase PhoE
MRIRILLFAVATIATLEAPRALAQPGTMLADTSAAVPRPPRDTTLVTVLLVRHAEKNTTMLGHDVPLSAAGQTRAKELVRVAGEAGIDAIYSTPFQRTLDTAAPIAKALGLTPIRVDDTAETVKRLRTGHWGQTVLVVGHSDTVPQIVEGLTGKKVPPFSAEFDLLYVVTLTRDGRSSIVRLHYGTP